MNYIFLIIALVLNAAANVMMKIGAGKLGAMKGLGIGDLIWKFASNYLLVIGIICFALNVVFYILALSKINISVAYPIMTAGGLLIITTFSFLYLKEPITWLQILGIILVASGITLIAYNLK